MGKFWGKGGGMALIPGVKVLLGFELINDTMIRIQGFQQGIGEEQRARKDMRSRGQGSREKGIEERAVRRDPTRMVSSLHCLILVGLVVVADRKAQAHENCSNAGQAQAHAEV